ncbi:hypothetical protein SUGI_0059480 [Cryptomeria japonica]|uniref:uncharacterized protein LOC131071621 n=1 Tax=Cryptomeria japonica TaxID=3369 RepID=UPI002408E2CC|nr:uncharacterized protein LOC131071621 [Cryptomeria japonica]GLJ07135.1 hypothetical protein SUGI_0059480 [Cryptomeria japonica]
MDIACFFVDQLKCTAIRVWNASGWNAQNGLQTLKEKSLVEEIEDPLPVLRMHDHLRDLRREIANEISHPRRLWHPQELKILESNGLKTIFSQTKGRCFHSIFDKSLNAEVQFFLRESDDREEMSSSLLWLHLCYPYVYCRPYSSNSSRLSCQDHLNFSVQPQIPSWIPLQNVQCLRVGNGYFKRLWQQDAEASSQMKELKIYGTLLEEFPDLLGILTHVERELNDRQRMSKMKLLMVNTRRKISRSLQKIQGGKFIALLNGGQDPVIVKASLSLLEYLVIREQENIIRIVTNGNQCPNLKSLDLSSLINLNEVQFTSVETLHCLKVSKCEHLKRLSATSSFTELEELNISTCPKLEEPSLGFLSCLKRIRIAYCNLKSVPGISSFRMLVELNINRCPKLDELSLAHLRCLEKVIIKDCHHLKSVTGLSHLPKLVEVNISWCWILELELCLLGLNRLKRVTVDKFVKAKCFELNACKNLETVSGISFKMIHVVNICDCPELAELPIISGANCLECIAINGCGKLNHIMMADCGILRTISGNFDPVGLSISDCPMLEELPRFERATYLEDIRILQCGKLQKVSLPATLKLLELNACRELKTIHAISALTELLELKIGECPQLELGVADMIWLEKLAIVKLKSVSEISNLTKLIELKISECLELEVELSLSNLSCLESIDIVQCGKMHMITLLTNLTKFSLEACRDLETVVGISDLTKLAELNVKQCPQLQLELDLSSLNTLKTITIIKCGNVHNMILPMTLMKLKVQRCRKLRTMAGIGNLTRLTELCIYKCPELEELPVICGASCLEMIAIDGCRKLNRLQVSDCGFFIGVSGLQFCISDCPELEEICIFRCEKLQKISLPTTLKSLHLDTCKDLKSMSKLSYLKNLLQLIIVGCRQLELELGLHLDCMDSLQNIKIDGCGKLLLNKCKNLHGVSLSCNFDEACLPVSDCPELVFPNLAQMNCWESISIVSCEKLQKVTLSWTLMKLTVQRCKELQTLVGIGNHTKLSELYISECPELEELPNLATLCCLETISINSCDRLHTITLPTSLMKLSLQSCRQLETVATISGLTKLVELNIKQCPELQPGLDLSSLNFLKRIVVVECWNMHSITTPITLEELTVQRCRKLKTVAAVGSLTELADLYISDCEELDELPSLAGLNCLKRINIDCCKKLHNLTLPAIVIKLTVKQWGESQTLAGIGNLTKLTDLCIGECPELEELPSLARLCCLETLNINSCEKLHTIQLPRTLIKLIVQRCRELETILGMDYLKNLKELCISECPELEEIRLFRCQKLQKLTLPTTLKSLHLQDCTELKTVSEISHLKNLVQLIISRCWQLELELRLEGMNSLQKITIDECMALKSILLKQCKNLKRVSLCCYFNVARLSVCDCPELEFINLGGESSWESICIYSCEKLEEIAGIEELHGSGAIQLLYCNNASIQDCIAMLQSVPSDYLLIMSRAGDGAKSNLNPSLFSEGFFCADEVSMCRQDLFKWLGSTSAIIICAVVEINSSTHLSLEQFLSTFYLREGELIITTVITDQSDKMFRKFNKEFEDVLIEHGLIKKWCACAVKKGLVWRTLHVLHTITQKIIDKLHEKQEQIKDS